MAEISIDAKNASKISGAMKRATVSAINKTMRKARVAASKEVRAIYNIKAKDLKKSIIITRARGNKPISNHMVSGQRLKLIYFTAGRSKKKATVRIKRTEQAITILSAFKATMKTGHVGIFMRKGKARLPIRELTTLDLPTMYDIRAEKIFDKTVTNEIGKIFDHEFDYQLSKIA